MSSPSRPTPPDDAPDDAPEPSDQRPATLDACRRCDLWRNATHGVPGDGPTPAPVMVVGEQPGNQEDLAGKAFVGPAGRLLDEAFEKAGLSRESVFLTNAVKHFKWELRGKRRLHKTPAQREIEACGYWLEEELERVAPRVVVALGATALKAVLGVKATSLRKVLRQPIEHEGRTVIPTYHPSYALRVPDPAAREAAFDEIVAALKLAAKVSGKAARKRAGGSVAKPTAAPPSNAASRPRAKPAPKPRRAAKS
ncbi:UdgX family uracil-DNA binding protein [Cupriavidus sp. UGS-1]|uniref:UdgX family uracil-DNA binding protein n=1 Tax=Cupriavidus sp. UGS-1 TaxID=2899826 RepID=UPI001E2C7C23|nr:UdgX family uracil-DNA binding protein [Cupriavidus sp. UGS-1]MCD9122511.1 UdgX family uracil-DNA binding protein [Cupriavidus sp. UGS-1]